MLQTLLIAMQNDVAKDALASLRANQQRWLKVLVISTPIPPSSLAITLTGIVVVALSHAHTLSPVHTHTQTGPSELV